ncbi:MAG: hypothetical protein MHM6MM_005551 [Cercozoa sp. M6MM]
MLRRQLSPAELRRIKRGFEKLMQLRPPHGDDLDALIAKVLPVSCQTQVCLSDLMCDTFLDVQHYVAYINAHLEKQVDE